MVLSEEELTDHLLHCKACRQIRVKSMNKIHNHMDELNEHEICKCCGVPEHMKTCLKCRYLSLKVYNAVALHLKFIRLKKVVQKLFFLIK